MSKFLRIALGNRQFWQANEELKLLGIDGSQDLGLYVVDRPDPLQATRGPREEAGPSNGAADHPGIRDVSPAEKQEIASLHGGGDERSSKRRKIETVPSNDVMLYVPSKNS